MESLVDFDYRSGKNKQKISETGWENWQPSLNGNHFGRLSGSFTQIPQNREGDPISRVPQEGSRSNNGLVFPGTSIQNQERQSNLERTPKTTVRKRIKDPERCNPGCDIHHGRSGTCICRHSQGRLCKNPEKKRRYLDKKGDEVLFWI